MKVVFNKIIPFPGFSAINLFGIMFVRKGAYRNDIVPAKTYRHESIHTEQMMEMGYIVFYIWYFIEWFIRLFINGKNAYYNISFEREAYKNQDDKSYLEKRKRYNWLNYYGK